jgi:hypothetical protein
MTLNSVKRAVEKCLPAVLAQHRLASRAMRDGAWVAKSGADAYE